MRTERMERGFWAVAICRAPGGWAVNLGPYMFFFGSFNQRSEAAKVANAYSHVFALLQTQPRDDERDALVWEAVRAALYAAGVTSHSNPHDDEDDHVTS